MHINIRIGYNLTMYVRYVCQYIYLHAGVPDISSSTDYFFMPEEHPSSPNRRPAFWSDYLPRSDNINVGFVYFKKGDQNVKLITSYLETYRYPVNW